MNFLQADERTYNKWQKYTNINGRFEFRELADGRKIVHQDILSSTDFPEIIPDLEKLPKTTFDEND